MAGPRNPIFLDTFGGFGHLPRRDTPPQRGAAIWKGRLMTTATKPAKRPGNICFSSGPCAKRPGWSLKALEIAFLGRSHRATDGKARLKLAIDKTKTLLGLPPGYLVAIVPASDTGAFEMAMWSMLGARGVEALAWESFGKGWVTDAAKQLKLKDFKATEAE